YRSFQVPKAAPFELRPSPGKGWGVFATRNVKEGTRILSEKALFVIRKYHTHIEKMDVVTAFQALAPSDKHQFLLLRDNASNPFNSMENACAENSFTFPGDGGHRLFLPLSRFNHSCVPNSKIPDKSTGENPFGIYAIRDILAGEEITFCYETDFEART
ncbi:SET domain-containing protein, partial [Bimuria novae-zelandiae CBS 107.79]